MEPRMDQYSIRHVLKSRKWRAAWEEVRRSCGVDFEDERRQRIWEGAVQMQGLEGFEMLRPGGKERWRERLVGLREKIEAMDAGGLKSAEVDVHGDIDWLECPVLADEVLCCVRGMWPVCASSQFSADQGSR